jgi:hypothetical protein
MRSVPLIQCVALAAVLAAGAMPAQATLSAGNAIELTYLYPNLNTVYPGAGPITIAGSVDSVSNFAGILNIHFTDTSILMTLTVNAGINGVAFDGLRFTDVNKTLSFSGLALDVAATNYAQFDASRISYQGDSIFINLVDVPGQAGQRILLSASPVPEPGQWALMFGGLALLGGLAHGRRRAVAD